MSSADLADIGKAVAAVEVQGARYPEQLLGMVGR
ncbi:hypothetical protein ACVWY2_005412 [Bradyrhizobium sp. JR6.1]